ncbi:MAG TPA: methylated-DNA--[protein]-cysteine S-methyltransferase [Bryobacteraceae bacterium]|jgi:methylated-DNA-[protein]-cysteine S-methyltransferase
MNYRYVESPIGKLLIAGDNECVRRIEFPNNGEPRNPAPGWIAASTPTLDEAARQLREYFFEGRTEFELPLTPEGTEFQKTVWRELRNIPYGRTISYGELARRVGNPNASRAVGAANGANPIPIVIPCHRVIGANGKLTGFGGGLPVKERLLTLEAGLLKP